MAQSYDRRINLYINGTKVRNDAASIRKEMYKLTNELSHLTIGTAEYNRKAAELRNLKSIYNRHQETLRATTHEVDKLNKSAEETSKKFNLGKMADGFNRYFTMFTTFAASFAGVALTVKSTVQAFAKFDDKLADVMKTTGLTRNQVLWLDKAFADLDTRSSQEELLDLARVAGKLGITAQEDVLGFVRAADKIKVALTEDLGGNVEESINELGKLVDIFKLTEEFGIEQALLKVGSAINSLGAAGTANEGYLVELSKRMAGIAPSAGISIDKVLGLAATLDELGQPAEMAGTAISQVITKMFKETATYAGIAGMSVKEFTEILNRDANEAFIQLMQGAKGSGTGFAEMAMNLDALGLDGARSTAVLGALADNIDKLREKQAYSNAEFEKGTSILNEFNIKNNTTQAQLDKAKDSFTRLQVQLGEKLAPVYGDMIHKGSAMLRIFGTTVEFLLKYGSTLVTLTALIIAYTVAIKAAALWEARLNKEKGIGLVLAKLNTAAYHAQFAAIALYNAGVALLSGNLKKAAIQMRAFSAALNATPLGIALTVISALVVAVKTYDQVNARAVENEKQKRQAVANLANANKLLEATYTGITRQINDLNTLSIQEKKDLQDKIDLTLQQAQAELLAQQARQTEIQQNNTRATLWQTIMNAMKSGGNAVSMAMYNAADAADNGAKAAATMNDGLGALLKNIEDLRAQKVDLSNILNAEAIGDAIGTESLVQLEEKMNRYQTALKNAAVGGADYLRIQQKIADVQKQIGTRGTGIDNPDNKEAAKLLETANQQRILMLKEQYGAEENMQKLLQARLLANEIAYMQAKANLEPDESKKLALQIQIVDAQNKYNQSIKEAVDGLRLKEKAVEDVNTKLLEEAKLTQRAAEVAAQAAADQDDLNKKLTSQAQLYQDTIQVVSDGLFDMMSGSEDAFKTFAKNILIFALEQLKLQVQMAAAGATIQSLSQPDSIATFGVAGLKRAAIIVGLIEAAFAGIEGLVSNAFSSGKRKGYSSGGFTGPGEITEPAGVVHKGEWVAPKWMVDHPALKEKISSLERIRSSRNLVNPMAVKSMQYPGKFSSGGYTAAANNLQDGGVLARLMGGSVFDKKQNEVILQLAEAVDKLMRWKPKVYTELIKRDLDTLDEIEQKRGM